MDSKPKRPLSVRIAQILLSILSVIFLVVLVFVVWSWVSDYLRFRVGTRRTSDLILFLSWLIFALSSIAGVLGMAQRRSWGRWLSVAALIVVFIFFVFVLFGVVYYPGPTLYYGYAGAVIGITLIDAGLLWLILHLSFSKNMANFFSSSLSPGSDVPPPPPSSFED